MVACICYPAWKHAVLEYACVGKWNTQLYNVRCPNDLQRENIMLSSHFSNSHMEGHCYHINSLSKHAQHNHHGLQ